MTGTCLQAKSCLQEIKRGLAWLMPKHGTCQQDSSRLVENQFSAICPSTDGLRLHPPLIFQTR